MERIASDLSGRDVGVIGLPAVLLAAGLSGAAWGLTKLRCGGGQGADVFGIGWTRSTYCRALHLPGFPASAASVLFTVGLFLFPVVVTSIGLFIAYRTGALDRAGFDGDRVCWCGGTVGGSVDTI